MNSEEIKYILSHLDLVKYFDYFFGRNSENCSEYCDIFLFFFDTIIRNNQSKQGRFGYYLLRFKNTHFIILVKQKKVYIYFLFNNLKVIIKIILWNTINLYCLIII